jgi:hypothetical protein
MARAPFPHPMSKAFPSPFQSKWSITNFQIDSCTFPAVGDSLKRTYDRYAATKIKNTAGIRRKEDMGLNARNTNPIARGT